MTKDGHGHQTIPKVQESRQPSGFGSILHEHEDEAAALPGGLILIDRHLIERYDDPAVTAGFILAAAAPQQTGRDLLNDLLTAAPLRATMSLLTTGDLPDGTLQTKAQSLQATVDYAVTPADLQAAFDAAAETQMPDLTPGHTPAATRAAFHGFEIPRRDPILDDRDWVRLQGICGS